MNGNHLEDLKKEVKEIRDRHPAISIDNAFVSWFLRAFITDNEESAIKALTGGAKDKGVDAIYTDHNSRIVFIIQGKYHQGPKPPSENRSDVIALGDLGRVLLNDEPREFRSLLKDSDLSVKDELEKARKLIHRHGYSLNLQFVSTGKVSKTHKNEAEQKVYEWDNASFQAFSRGDLVRLMRDYVEGAAPPVPTIILPIHGEQLFTRFDESTGISSWVFTILGGELGKLYNEIGVRLFARNIRGFLGNTDINRGMENTISNEPDHFWYFNNGVTIVCDEAKQITEKGKKNLRVTNAQIINGQQTTRILAKYKNKSGASLLVKVISVPRDSEDAHLKYNQLISSIVSATNWQNAIKQSDLKSNDIEQIRLERDLRKVGYQYLRKKQTISEARRITGNRYAFFIKKEDLAKYAGACLLDPYEVRRGINRLFEDDVYSKIFDARNSLDYITFYWLHRIASWYSKGDIRRGYAKWLVLHFLWSELGISFKKYRVRENFRYISERYNDYYKELKPLYTAIDTAFKATMAFYRQNRKTEDGVIDESSFFRYKNLNNKFSDFWKTSQNSKRRQLVENRLNSFCEYLDTLE